MASRPVVGVLRRHVLDLAESGLGVNAISRAVGVSGAIIEGTISPEKAGARAKLQRAVGAGLVTRPDVCERCSARGEVHGHHHDYSLPLDVHWLCASCHVAAHVGQPYNWSRLSDATERAIWAVTQARQITRADLFDAHSLAEIVAIYQSYLGTGPARHRTLAEVDAEHGRTSEAA